jgi:hypothetical protein
VVDSKALPGVMNGSTHAAKLADSAESLAAIAGRLARAGALLDEARCQLGDEIDRLLLQH